MVWDLESVLRSAWRFGLMARWVFIASEPGLASQVDIARSISRIFGRSIVLMVERVSSVG